MNLNWWITHRTKKKLIKHTTHFRTSWKTLLAVREYTAPLLFRISLRAVWPTWSIPVCWIASCDWFSCKNRLQKFDYNVNMPTTCYYLSIGGYFKNLNTYIDGFIGYIVRVGTVDYKFNVISLWCDAAFSCGILFFCSCLDND